MFSHVITGVDIFHWQFISNTHIWATFWNFKIVVIFYVIHISDTLVSRHISSHRGTDRWWGSNSCGWRGQRPTLAWYHSGQLSRDWRPEIRYRYHPLAAPDCERKVTHNKDMIKQKQTKSSSFFIPGPSRFIVKKHKTFSSLNNRPPPHIAIVIASHQDCIMDRRVVQSSDSGSQS